MKGIFIAIGVISSISGTLILPCTCMDLYSINIISLDEIRSCNSISYICYLSWINMKSIYC